MNKEELLSLLNKKIEECYKTYKKILIQKKNDFNSLHQLEKLILNFTTKKIFFESLDLSEKEAELYYNDINSIDIESMFI